MNNVRERSSESGNILIYILGAIILIGLLVVMVKGSTTPGSGIDNEALAIKVAEVQQYGMELERAVTYILRDGYSETDIRFAHPNHSSLYGDITDEPGRQVFARAGGGATWKDNDTDIQTTDADWSFNFGSRIHQVGNTTGTRYVANEILAVLPYVTEEFCILVNEKNDITNPSGSPPVLTTGCIDSSSYYGLNDQACQMNIGPNINGKLEGCVENSGILGSPPAGTFSYYRVLLAR